MFTQLQREFVIEKAHIEQLFADRNKKALDSYNEALEYNHKLYSNDLNKLTDQYNNLLKQIEKLSDAARITTLQLNNSYTTDIITRLKKTLADLPKIENIRLRQTFHESATPEFLYKIKLSFELSTHLIPNIIPADEYILTIPSYHIKTHYALNINTQSTSDSYMYCVSKQHDILILYNWCYEIGDDIYVDDYITDTYVIFFKLSTMEYIDMRISNGVIFNYYDNNIVSYQIINNSTRFTYYIFEPYTLIYNTNIVDYPWTIAADMSIYGSLTNKSIYYIHNNKLFIAHQVDDIVKIHQLLDLCYIISKLEYKKKISVIEIVSLENYILTIACIHSTDTPLYIKIKLSYSFIVEKNIYNDII